MEAKTEIYIENIAYSNPPSLSSEQGEKVRRACFHVSCSYDHLTMKKLVKLLVCDPHSLDPCNKPMCGTVITPLM